MNDLNYLLERLDVLSRRKAKEACTQRVSIKSVFVEVECEDFTRSVLVLAFVCCGAVGRLFRPVGGLTQSWMGLDAKHSDQCLYIIEEFPRWLERFHVNLFSFNCLVLFERPNRVHLFFLFFALISSQAAFLCLVFD